MTFAPRLLTAVGLVPTLAVAALCVSRPALLQRLELTAYDVVVRATPRGTRASRFQSPAV